MMDRRGFIQSCGISMALGMVTSKGLAATGGMTTLSGKPPAIGAAEYRARLAKVQKLMQRLGFGALLIEPGSSLVYFTGVNWWRSERVTCAIIPAEGRIKMVTPLFEEPSVRETLAVDADVRTWLEHEDPLALVAGILRDAGLGSAVVGSEETNRFFIIDGLQRNLPTATVRNAAAVVRGCRMIKTAPEIALMQYATNITVAAYRYTAPRVRAGMRPADIALIMKEATQALGGHSEFEEVLIGPSAAFPHGSDMPQIVKPGEIVLMDCGCSVDSYQSDISRTFVYGKPNTRQREVWAQVQHGQQIAFAAAKIGATAGSVDDAVRAYYTSLGYGPDYRVPGLSHRTGHGIGLDGHEPINLVRGEAEVLQPGMCFSDEPGIYIPGELGVRLEDCFYMTETGPRWFSQPPRSIDQPV